MTRKLAALFCVVLVFSLVCEVVEAGLLDSIKDAANKVKDKAEAIKDKVADKVDDLKDKVKEKVAPIKDKIDQAKE
uniref:YtxH domain-containing protein n=2 Tax=Bursaphelenchus xylophilus TaxID=6326 RepID=A0A1I7SHB6_BURXY